jgi:hypothetical protein
MVEVRCQRLMNRLPRTSLESRVARGVIALLIALAIFIVSWM